MTLASETGVVKRRWSLRQRVQHVDRPADVERLPEPAGARRARVEAKTLRIVTRAERRDGIFWHRGGCRDFRQRVSVGPPEPKCAVGPAPDLKAFFVHRPMMPTA